MATFSVIFFVLALIALVFPMFAQAQCPACTVAVVAGVGLSRYLGIDDTISGVWMGVLTVVTALWIVRWFESRKIRFMFRRPLIVIGIFLLTVVPLYWMKMIGYPLNILFGIDKLLFGLLTGGVLFIVALFLDEVARIIHHGRVYVPFQRVIIPVLLLLLGSLAFYLITK